MVMVGAVGGDVAADGLVVRDDDDGPLCGRGGDLSTDDVVGADACRRVDDASQATTRSVAADDVRTVEHDGEVRAEPAGDVVDGVEQSFPQHLQLVVRPRLLGDVVTVEEDSGARRAKQELRRP